MPPAIQSIVDGQIIMTEPRRVAARAAARRIADEAGVRVGEEVGYHVRFDRKRRDDTGIVVATEGIVVRMLQNDPFLEGIGALVFDEFHERSVDTDVALALAREIQRDARPDLLLIVMSATLDPVPIAAWLGGASIVRSEGRTHPVEIRYPERPDDRPMEVQAAAAAREVMRDPSGHALVFLPGYREIRKTQEMLSDLNARVDVLHGSLDPKEQDRVVSGDTQPRVILSTNVAESSLTIPGVRTVIDSGWARVMRNDPSTGLDRLLLERISLASAQQRAGRAGREAPGDCLRLWSTAAEHRMSDDLEAEIHRVDLAPVALQLLAWGVPDPAQFGWFEAPAVGKWTAALRLLEALGASESGHITPLGTKLAKMPLHPRLGRMILAGAKLGVLQETCLAAAILSERDVLKPAHHRDSAKHTSDSDLLDRVRLIESGGRTPGALRDRFRHASIAPTKRAAKQLLRSAPKDDRRTLEHDEAFGRAVLAAFPDRVGRRRTEQAPAAHLADGKGATLHPSSALSKNDRLFVAVHAAPPHGGKGDAVVTIAGRIEEGWLDESLIESRIEVRFDRSLERVTASAVRSYLAVQLAEHPAPLTKSAASEAALLGAARAAPAKALNTADETFDRLRARWEWVRSARPDLELIPLDDDGLGEFLPMLCHGKSSFKELRAIDLASHIRNAVPYREWQRLDQLAPESISIPSGRTAKLRYEDDGPPVLAVRIQELFGLQETPRVAGGKVPLVVHLLAPNGRPQQITSDLGSFWKNGYPEVRKELRSRYPRHSWPDDPSTAPAQRRPARRKRK
ncbi:MAG: ATP-dependent helicase HrpB [Bradymonadia bacterium]